MFESITNGTALITLFFLIGLGAALSFLLMNLFQYFKKLKKITDLNLEKEKHKEQLYEMKELSEQMQSKLDNLPPTTSLNEIIRKKMSLEEIEEFLDLYTDISKKITYIHSEIASQAKTTNQKLNASPGLNKKGNNQSQNNQNNQNQNNSKKNNNPEESIKKFLTNQIKKTLNIDNQNEASEIATKIINELKNQNFEFSTKSIESLKNGCPELKNQDITSYIQNNYSS